MENFCINLTFSIICCMFWIFSLADVGSISEAVGSTVILPCKDESNDTLVQLTWKTNGITLLSFKPQVPLHTSGEARRWNINITDSPPYALLIKNVQESHSGNYTCEINTDARFLEHKWELIITGKSENVLMITVASVVPCVCCLIFILAWIILHRVRIQRAEDHSPTARMEREEDIYENCLGMYVSQQRSDNQSHCYHERPH